MKHICSVCGRTFSSGLRDNHGKLYCSEVCYETTFPVCAICGKPMRQWLSDESGRKYCSETCFERVLPHCEVCGQPLRQWLEVSGKKYCDENCFNRTLPKCATCGAPVNGGIRDERGRLFCRQECFEKALPKCKVCGKRMRNWIIAEDGSTYCSEECFETSLPRCSICGKPVHKGYISEKGQYFCSDECYEKSLPVCSVCGKPIKNGWVDQDGRNFCSEECYETTLPRCANCGKPMHEWLVTENGQTFCSHSCIEELKAKSEKRFKIDMESTLTSQELAYLTGLSNEDCSALMNINNINGDQALEAIDIFMQALNEHVEVPLEIAVCMTNAGIYVKMAGRLSAYNTMRGGTKGYGGFVFEELHAADAAAKGANIQVLANNGPADFITIDAHGKQTLIQAKAGYKPNQIDWSKYEGQRIVVDKGNTALANDARAAGLTVEESGIFKSQAECLARAQQWESAITGNATAPITASVASAHYAGLACAKLAARVGVSLKLGATIYDMLSGDRKFEDAAADFVVDGIVLVGGAYLGGAALTLAGTAAGVLGSTAVGTAVTGAVTGIATAVGGTTIGAAVISGVGAVATGIGGVVTAVASAPLFPVVCLGAAVGFVGKWLSS